MMKLVKEYEKEGYCKVYVPEIINYIDQLQSDLVDIIVRVSNKIDLCSSPPSTLSKETIINKYLPKIYKKEPKAFSFIYDSIKRHINLIKLVSSNNILEICKQLYPKNDNGYQTNISEVAMVMQRPNDDVFINGIHQDSGFFSEYASSNASMIVWIPMFDCFKKNGTLEIIPKSHLRGPLPHNKNEWEQRRNGSRNTKGLLYIKESDLSQDEIKNIKSIDCKKGEMIFMHYDLIHRSGMNASDEMRITFISRYSNLFGKNYIQKYGIW